MFNTPNSDVDRHLEAELQLENQSEKRMAKVALRSPWMRYSASAQMTNSEKEQSIGAEVTSEGKKVLVLDLALEQQSRGQKREFRPRVRIQLGEKEAVSLQGTVGVSKGRKNQLQINLEGNQKQFLKGSFVREGERKSSDIRISSDVSLQLFNGIEVRLNALLDKGIKHVTSDVTAEYRTRANQKKESLKVSLKVQNLTQSALRKMSAFAEVTSTQFPQYNTHVAYNVLNKPNEHVENELTVQWDGKLQKKVHVLQLTKASGSHVENTLTVEVTPMNINYELRANGERAGQVVKAEVAGKDRTGNRKELDFKAEMEYKHVTNKPLLLTLNANLKTSGGQYEYSDELRETQDNEFKGQTQMAWQSKGSEKKSARLDYEYKVKSTPSSGFWHEMKMQVEGVAKQPIHHAFTLRMSRDVKQVKAKLALDQARDYALEALLTNQGASKLEIAYPQYALRAHAQPWELPQKGMVEVVTPFGEHKSEVEVIPRQMLKVVSDTKNGRKENVFAVSIEGIGWV